MTFDMKKIFSGLDKTRKSIAAGIDNLLKNFVRVDENFLEELEEILIMADVGTATAGTLLAAVKDRAQGERAATPADIRRLLEEEIARLLQAPAAADTYPAAVLAVGVNGVGKTTTVGKLAYQYRAQGKKVLLAAADTFRAAAIDQLEIWGQRAGAEVIKHQEHSDPAAVVFDAIRAAQARKAEVLICDTAGRLHNKKNLMEELRKIFRILSQNYPEARQEVLLVLDASTGQNALQQARLFQEAAPVTGIALTKLDGTAKGGVVLSICNGLNIPVRFIGVGEGLDDLQPFDPQTFAKALFGSEE
jgi:fused signal recognition particle receptor